MARDKFRIRFRKVGDLRLVSHHDLMRCIERMLRRAALPFRSTEGFNPKPKMAFALSLALGIEGAEEVLELELEEVLPEEEVQARLVAQAPAGLEIVSVRRIEPRVKAQPRRACYTLEIPPERRDGIAERIGALLAATEAWAERTRPEPRRVDVRPYVRELRLDGGVLEMDLWVTPTGTARPDDILGLLGLADLLESGAVLRRTLLELHDEAVDGGAPNPEPGMETPASAGATPHADA